MNPEQIIRTNCAMETGLTEFIQNLSIIFNYKVTITRLNTINTELGKLFFWVEKAVIIGGNLCFCCFVHFKRMYLLQLRSHSSVTFLSFLAVFNFISFTVSEIGANFGFEICF